jgi:MFS family permease
MPESPRWLLHQGRYADTTKALGKLGIDVSEEDARRTAEKLEAQEAKEAKPHRRIWSPGVKRALMVVCMFFVFQQITGINVPFYYGPKLLGDVFKTPGSSSLDASMAGLQAAAILGAVNVIATFFAFRYIDRAGRRPLAIGGFAGMAVFMVVASVGVAFLTGAPKIAVVMVGFSLFITSFAIGVGGTGWLIQGEVFPTSVRGTAASIGASVDWLANFAVIVAFPALTAAMGLPWVMVLLAGLAVVAVAFVTRYLPETKHLTVEQVVAMFEEESGSSGRTPSVQPS